MLSSTAPPSSSHISTHQTGDTQEMGSVDVELVPPIYYYSSTFKPPGASRAPGTEMPSPRSSWTRPSQDDPLDLQSTSDKGEDSQMCEQKRRRQPESVKSEFARRWTNTSRIILSSYLMGYIFNITDHHLIYLIIIGMTLRCTTRILRGVRKRSPDLKKVQFSHVSLKSISCYHHQFI